MGPQALNMLDNTTVHDCQMLVLKGMSEHPLSAAVVWSVTRGSFDHEATLSGLLDKVSFVSDDSSARCIFQIALSATALLNLGIPEAAIHACGRSFTSGMPTPRLPRALGDGDPEKWPWSDQRGSLLWLLYARSEGALEEGLSELERVRQRAGLEKPQVLRTSLPEDGREPFGFRDGVTNITPRVPEKGGEPPKWVHKVAPGDVILGRQDAFDITTDFGWLGNGGSFLVARQIEQDVEGFWSYWLDQAGGDHQKQMWLAAKAMGR